MQTVKSSKITYFDSLGSSPLRVDLITSTSSPEDTLKNMLHNWRIQKEILTRAAGHPEDLNQRTCASMSRLARLNLIINEAELALHDLRQGKSEPPTPVF